MITLEQFRNNWEQLHFSKKKDAKILVAVSGGVDSMVLAHLLLQLHIPFGVAHCNFQLRGAEADLDEALVQQWCVEHSITFHLQRFNTQEVAETQKTGIQETARTLRYKWFDELLHAHTYGAVATAHHLNDNVETVLMNLFRGTGIAGLHGILPENGQVIRPLLFATKQDIAHYAASNNIAYREDASNQTDDYTRNAIRRQIIPAIEQFFPNASQQIQESILRFREAETLYDKAIAQERKQLIEQRGQDYYIPLKKLLLRKPLQTLVYELLLPFGFTPGQTPHIIKLAASESGHYVQSATHRIIRNRDFFIITLLSGEFTDLLLIEEFPATLSLGKYTYTFNVMPTPMVMDQGKDTALLDFKHIEHPLLLRKWKTGDYLYPIGMEMKKKKVSRMLINDKVPIHEKEHVIVLESNKRIAWIVGMRLDERFKIKPTTEKVLMVKRKLNPSPDTLKLGV